jgi:glycerol kinase
VTPGSPESSELVLAIDQGTSSTKALLVAPDGTVTGSGEAPVTSRSVGADGVELDPEEIWQSVQAAAKTAIDAAGAGPAAVALANQGETVLAWDRDSGRHRPRSAGRTDARTASAAG